LGNLSILKGTVTYAGLTLTQYLKMESKTSISFKITQAATLTMVLNIVLEMFAIRGFISLFRTWRDLSIHSLEIDSQINEIKRML